MLREAEHHAPAREQAERDRTDGDGVGRDRGRIGGPREYVGEWAVQPDVDWFLDLERLEALPVAVPKRHGLVGAARRSNASSSRYRARRHSASLTARALNARRARGIRAVTRSNAATHCA